MTTAAVVTAAGSSSRMRMAEKKEYLVTGGRPVIAAAIGALIHLDVVVTTVPEGHEEMVRLLVAPHLPEGGRDRVHYTVGGATRQRSVHRALEWLSPRRPDWVLIHDGARPWLSRELADRVLQGAMEHGACIPLVRLSEAPKLLDDSNRIAGHLERHRVAAAQTPQGFAFPAVLEAHARAAQEGRPFYDDAEIWDAYVGKVAWVEGDRANVKITYPEDLAHK